MTFLIHPLKLMYAGVLSFCMKKIKVNNNLVYIIFLSETLFDTSRKIFVFIVFASSYSRLPVVIKLYLGRISTDSFLKPDFIH